MLTLWFSCDVSVYLSMVSNANEAELLFMESKHKFQSSMEHTSVYPFCLEEILGILQLQIEAEACCLSQDTSC